MAHTIEAPRRSDATMSFKGVEFRTKIIEPTEVEDYRSVVSGIQGIKFDIVAGPGGRYFDEDLNIVPLSANETAIFITGLPELFEVLDKGLKRTAEERGKTPQAA